MTDGSGGPKEKRHWLRVHFVHEILLKVGGKEHLFNETYDISMDGVYIATSDFLPEGTEGRFEIKLTMGTPEGPRIRGKFRVKHVHKEGGPDHKQGMGISFFDMDDESSVELYRVITYNVPPE